MTDVPLNAGILQARLRYLPAPEPWYAGVLSLDSLPATAADRNMLLSLMERIATTSENTNANHSIFLQSWCLSPTNGADVVSAHRRALRPKLGLGIWPEREAPGDWDEERLQNAAAAMMQGEQPELPYYQVLQVAEGEGAVSLLRGTGLVVDLFHSDTKEAVEQKIRGSFISKLREDKHRRASVFCPLLSAQSMTASTSAAEVEAWVGGADLYMRESAEDHGLFLLARSPLNQLLDLHSQEHR